MDKLESINQLFRDAGQIHGYGAQNGWHQVKFNVRINADGKVIEISNTAKLTPLNIHQEQEPYFVLLNATMGKE